MFMKMIGYMFSSMQMYARSLGYAEALKNSYAFMSILIYSSPDVKMLMLM
jgi:hypothetical protein